MELKTELELLHNASFGWAMSCCRGDRIRAEEVLQDVYLKIFQSKAIYRGESNLKTWLFAVIRKTAVSEHRRHILRSLRFPTNASELADRAYLNADQDSALERSETQARFRIALNSLPARQRQALHLVFYEDLSLRQVADVMSVSIGSARRHYDRGKKRLREVITRMEVGHANNWRGTEFPNTVP